MDIASSLQIPAPLRSALLARGYSELTPVQVAVLDPQLAGRDLRISSQTGSGKTVAMGFSLAEYLLPKPTEGEDEEATGVEGEKGPRAVILVPTRELAAQVRTELSWLYGECDLKIAQVTGGTSFRDELRELRRGTSVVVGTPGRFRDHLERGSLSTGAIQAVVLDEADQMLDLGFREDLETILGAMPESRRTHLVSATFPREVQELVERFQRGPASVQGTRLGEANANISHVMHVVPGSEKAKVIVNLLLFAPDEQTLIFCKTRDGVGQLARFLVELGFAVAPLSGDMEQSERTRTLEAFRRGMLRAVVATDVAARGIDVPDVTRVIHADLPGNSEVYTHRSGRTGRAGRTGTSLVLAMPSEFESAMRLLRHARVAVTLKPVLTPDEVLSAAGDRLVSVVHDQTARSKVKGATDGEVVEGEGAEDAEESSNEGPSLASDHEPAVRALAQRLLEGRDPMEVVLALLGQVPYAGPCAPFEVDAPDMHRFLSREKRVERPGPRGARDRSPGGGFPSRRGVSGRRDFASPGSSRERHPAEGGAAPRSVRGARSDEGGFRGMGDEGARAPRRSHESSGSFGDVGAPSDGFSAFTINWGERQGADPRRLLAMVCRRGNVRGGDVGAIRIGPSASVFEVRKPLAKAFATHAEKPDAREPWLRITPLGAGPAGPAGPRPASPRFRDTDSPRAERGFAGASPMGRGEGLRRAEPWGTAEPRAGQSLEDKPPRRRVATLRKKA